MRKQEVDSLRGLLILNSKDTTLDLGNQYIKRNLCTYSLIWTWFLGYRCMQPSSWNAVNVGFVSSNAKGFESWKLCNAHEILSYFFDFILIWLIFVYFPFLWKTQIGYLFLKYVITHETSSYAFCKSLWGLPKSVCFVWFSDLTILEWQQWSRLTFNKSTEILILGISP